MKKNRAQKPQPVMFGSVTNAFVREQAMLSSELAAHRQLANDLRVWFKLHPDASESFGAFQVESEKKRSAARAKHA